MYSKKKMLSGALLAIAATALLPMASSIAAPQTTTHRAAELAQGQFDNTSMINGTVRLANDRRFVPRNKSHNLFGLYTSPAQTAAATFDSVTVNYLADIPTGSVVTFEIRALQSNGIWLPWTEVTDSLRNKPIALEAAASAWQYKLTLFANEPRLSPSVGSITVTTDGGAK